MAAVNHMPRFLDKRANVIENHKIYVCEITDNQWGTKACPYEHKS